MVVLGSIAERRIAILRALNKRRFDTVGNLAVEFKVSERTIRNDIKALSYNNPIITTKGRYGGISVDEDWYFGRKYLSRGQENVLRKILPYLNGEDEREVLAILEQFAYPETRE